VIVEVDVPLATTGPLPVIVEFVVEASGVKTTDPPVKIIGVASERTFVSPVVEESVQVETPELLVAEHVPKALLLPLTVKVGTVPTTALLFTSFKVIVMVEVELPSALTGDVPTILDVVAEAVAAENVTVPPAFTTGVAIDSVFTSL
jgi:hypothetical protein